MSKREKIKQQIFDLIRLYRKKIDPAVLARAEQLAQAQLQQMHNSTKAEGSIRHDEVTNPKAKVPYDQEAAKDIVERFLILKQGDKNFIDELKRRLTK